jgi:hypothetical protein
MANLPSGKGKKMIPHSAARGVCKKLPEFFIVLEPCVSDSCCLIRVDPARLDKRATLWGARVVTGGRVIDLVARCRIEFGPYLPPIGVSPVGDGAAESSKGKGER